MVPTLAGRIQTRLFLLALIGVPVTLLITPLLPLGGRMGVRYGATFGVLLAVGVVGIGWELLYHFIMQWRWEKDWPTLFGLVTAIPEGVFLWWLTRQDLVPGVDRPLKPIPFAIHFLSVWVAVWLVANGPMRVPFIRWRFHGGRLL